MAEQINERQLSICEEHCPMLHRVELLEEQTKVQGEQITKAALSQVSLEKDVECILNKINEISVDVKNIMSVPTDRYNKIVICVITAIIGAYVGYIIK